jgi:hypothetical protein
MGQDVTWHVPVTSGQAVALAIQAAVVSTPGAGVNTATFSSTMVLNRAATVLIYGNRVFLPLILKET